MATGQNIQPRRGIETTAITPSVNFDTGEAQVWDAVGKVADQMTERAKPGLRRRAQQRGAEEGRAVAAGEMEAPQRGLLFGGDIGEARQAAYEDAYVAGVANDVDAREAEVRQRNSHNLEAYEREMTEVRSGFIQGALWRDNLDERRATIRMRIVSRSVRMIVAARHERKPFNLAERRSG